ncbi:hypothetical protein AYO49_03385 [Verrucomicrobiaceae bacterium SCGC AG-212-N21]|nr:hypothetical protein AYO49_03385 [Verrucomicrobiaceae bacterium SCGC AG-212-N21]
MINSAGEFVMHTRNRWQTWSAGFALLLAGCDQTEAPKAPNGAAQSPAPPASAPAVVELAAAKDQPAAQPASPASLDEATRVIDLRKYPLPDDGKDLYKSAEVPKGDRGKDLLRSARALTYNLRRLDGAQVAQFVRTKLSEEGWKLRDAPPSTDFFEFTGIKQGFFLSGSVYENRAEGLLAISITNHGNIDSRLLPRFAGAELKDNDVSRTIYLTDAKPDAVLEFTRAELKKRGWREVRMEGGLIDNEPGYPVILRFIQRGIEITTSVEGKKERPKSGIASTSSMWNCRSCRKCQASCNSWALPTTSSSFTPCRRRDLKKCWNSTARSCPP